MKPIGRNLRLDARYLDGGKIYPDGRKLPPEAAFLRWDISLQRNAQMTGAYPTVIIGLPKKVDSIANKLVMLAQCRCFFATSRSKKYTPE